MGYLIAAAILFHAVWVFLDARKRRNEPLGWAIGTALLWLFVVPFYLAKRNLKAGETREGGTGWNVLRTLTLLWTMAMIAVGISYLSSVSQIASTAHSGAEKAGAAIGGTLGIALLVAVWFVPAAGALSIGLLVKKASLVETGPTGPLTDTGTGGIPPARMLSTLVGAAVLILFLFLGARAYVNRDLAKARTAVPATHSAAAAVRPTPSPTQAGAADRTAGERLSIASFTGGRLKECDDLETTGEFRLPDGRAVDLADMAKSMTDSQKKDKNPPSIIKEPCAERFRDHTPLATCTFTKTNAKGTLRGRMAFYSLDVFRGDDLMKECSSTWQGTWDVVSPDSEAFRLAQLEEADPKSPVTISDPKGDVQFGKATVKDSGFGTTKVMVQVRNMTARKITCVVESTFMKQDTILGTAHGAVNAISVGSSKTAELMTMDKIRGYDTLKLETGACF